jgi:glycosyltransferase involved in cell wall biosynthesis
MKSKVIVFTTDTIQRGGKERQLFLLAKYLLNKGYVVRIISFKISPDNYLKEYNIPEDHIFVLNAGYRYLNYVKYSKTIQALHPDIVFSWDLQTSLFNLFLNRKGKYKIINGSIQHGIKLFRFSHLLRSFICQLSPFIVANSFAGLKVNNLKPGTRRFILYNGIEAKFLNNYSKTEIKNLRDKIIPGYYNNPGFIYVSVANFVPYKDYYTVLKALAKLKNDSIFYFLILGDGPMKSEIDKTINSYSLEERVLLIGKTENVMEYLFASDIMIHSSRGEGISNAILEGMYAGLPVIATNVGGIPETVFPESSLLFPYKDDQALYQCLLKSQELKSSFNPESDEYRTHLKKFSVENMVSRFEEIIQTVISKKK